MLTKRLLITIIVMAVLLVGAVSRVGAQEESGIAVNLTPAENNPILTIGEAGAWDSRGVGTPRVIYSEGVFHLFYLGWATRSSVVGVGYATSEDGLRWTKYENNPVFVPDAAITPYGVFDTTVILDGETWVMYFTPLTTDYYSPARTVLRATALSPTGPWMMESEPVFNEAGVQDWTGTGIAVNSVLHIDQEYVMYYDGVFSTSVDKYYRSSGIGRATSRDGVYWTKYDDPATTTGRFSVSDPVFLPNKENAAGWDYSDVGSSVVRYSENGWEMFYYGGGSYFSIGYATSQDGINWTRFGDAPIMTNYNMGYAPGSILVIDNRYYLYYSHFVGSTTTIQIGVATGTITRK